MIKLLVIQIKTRRHVNGKEYHGKKDTKTIKQNYYK